MQDFAKSFYSSPAWKKTRKYIFLRDSGLCVRCGAHGDIVHHIIPLTPENIDDESITLDENNLELVCRNCHAVIHEGTLATGDGLMFDDQGNIIKTRGKA